MTEDAGLTQNPAGIRILALCSGNSCRSQMVEAWFRALAPERVEAFSAGVRPAGFVHPLAIRVMAEAEIDISSARSKAIDNFLQEPFDYVITVCAPTAEACPVFPGNAVRLHWPLDDPAEAQGDEPSRLEGFRRVRDEVRERVLMFLNDLARSDPA